MRQANPTFKLSAVLLACGAMLSACGGGGGDTSGGMVQDLTFYFPGGTTLAARGSTATVDLQATASSGLPVTFESQTPSLCSVSGSTLSLLAAGECRVTGTQAGGNGYASASLTQLFVIPKHSNSINGFLPDYQMVGDAPLTLTVVAESGATVTLGTTTPTICKLEGTTLTALAKGACVITASAPGDATFVDAKARGTLAINPLVFASGYKSNGADFLTDKHLTTNSSTLEGGVVTTKAGSDWDKNLAGDGNTDWNCWDSNWCKSTVAADGSSLSWSYTPQKNDPNHVSNITWGLTQWTWLEMYIAAPTAGLQTTIETTLKIKLQTNAEWYKGGHLVRVRMKMGKIGSESCNIELQSDVLPTSATSDIWVSLKNESTKEEGLTTFGFSDSCNQSNLTVESVLQSHPISEINVRAHDSNGDNGANRTIASPAADYPNGPAYQTKFTLGAITLQ
jgi:hypothetical protein